MTVRVSVSARANGEGYEVGTEREIRHKETNLHGAPRQLEPLRRPRPYNIA